MDGYAVRAADVANVPVRLKIIGEVAAGRPFARAVGPGEAARIFTGGVMPDGADTVVIQEHTKRDGDCVEVEKPTAKGRHIRAQGLDFKAGDALLAAGHRLTARDLALAAAMNHPLVPVHRRPKIALFATGDELVPPGMQPAPGQIVSSNNFALAALARARRRRRRATSASSPTGSTRRSRRSGARANSAPTFSSPRGGASVGDYDLVQPAFAAEGMELSFWKLALRPGRPLMHGRLGAMQVLGVPGNPVSAFVCAFLFLVPLIRRLAGRSDLAMPTESALLGCDLPENDERADYLRATLNENPQGPVATPFPVQDSSMMTPLAKADCLVDPQALCAGGASRQPLHDRQVRAVELITYPPPRKRGRWRAKRDGGGVGSAVSLFAARPLHRASRGPPPRCAALRGGGCANSHFADRHKKSPGLSPRAHFVISRRCSVSRRDRCGPVEPPDERGCDCLHVRLVMFTEPLEPCRGDEDRNVGGLVARVAIFGAPEQARDREKCQSVFRTAADEPAVIGVAGRATTADRVESR